jgi:hypothetical protein
MKSGEFEGELLDLALTMDYDYSNQQQSPRQWSQPTTSGFSSPASPTPGYYYTPNQQSPSRPTSSSNLTLNLSSLSVTSPVNLGVSPITPVSPPNFSPAHLSPQPPFQFNFESTEDSSLLLDQRRPSTGSRPTSSSELAVEKSVPRKRSLTNTAPPPPTHHTHGHSHSYGGHILPHPIITTTASSPPSISEPSSQGPLTPASSQPSNQIDINATYDDPDGISAYSMADQGDSDDEGAKSSTAGPSLGVIGKPMGTNNFVTKLYQCVKSRLLYLLFNFYRMINDAKSQHFITWTDLGTRQVVSHHFHFLPYSHFLASLFQI